MFQPYHGIDHHHGEDTDAHDHAESMPKMPDYSQCAHEINVDGQFLVSTLHAPNCPLMDFDEAQNFCLDHGMRAISLSSSLYRHTMMQRLHMADMTPNGFWTIGFINNPNE